MAFAVTDWKAFLSPDSEFPPDVCFLLTGEDGNSTLAIRAHKWPLAGVSPVFMKQFFGPKQDERELIDVEKTTAEAFQTMIDFIYSKTSSRAGGQEAFSLKSISCPQKLYELLEVSDRYQVLGLKSLAKEGLHNFNVTRENGMFAATVANKYMVLFEDLSMSLSMKCLGLDDKGFEVLTTGPAGEDWVCALGRFERYIGEEREGSPVYKQVHTKGMPERDGDILLRRSSYSKEWFIEDGGVYPLLKANLGVEPHKPPITGWKCLNYETKTYKAAGTVTCRVISSP